jgi:hypothetical protein
MPSQRYSGPIVFPFPLRFTFITSFKSSRKLGLSLIPPPNLFSRDSVSLIKPTNMGSYTRPRRLLANGNRNFFHFIAFHFQQCTCASHHFNPCHDSHVLEASEKEDKPKKAGSIHTLSHYGMIS